MAATVVTGEGNAGEFVRMAAAELGQELPFVPYHGTLNLEGRREEVIEGLPHTVVADVGDGDYCTGVELYACRIDGVLASVIVPNVPGYPADKIEVLAPVHLRSLFGLADRDTVHLDPPETLSDPAVHRIDPAALGSFGAVVVDERLFTSEADGSEEWDRTGVASGTGAGVEAFGDGTVDIVGSGDGTVDIVGSGDGTVDAVIGRNRDGGRSAVERVRRCLAELNVDPGVAAFVTPDRDAVSAPFSVLSSSALIAE